MVSWVLAREMSLQADKQGRMGAQTQGIASLEAPIRSLTVGFGMYKVRTEQESTYGFTFLLRILGGLPSAGQAKWSIKSACGTDFLINAQCYGTRAAVHDISNRMH